MKKFNQVKYLRGIIAGTMIAVFTALQLTAGAQVKMLSLEEAVQKGVENSKQLKLSQNRIDQAASQLEQSHDAVLPEIKVSGGYSHALMLSRSFALPSSDGSDPKAMEFPFDNALYQSTLSINQPIFAGHKFRYAQESARLLVESGKLDAETQKDQVVYNIINAYINYYKILQNQKIVAQNLDDVDSKLTEIKKFENQGLATKNDVLRFELQRSNIQLQKIELENSRKVANYNLDILLGLPETTQLQVQDVSYKLDLNSNVDELIQQALQDRKELGAFKFREKLADINIKKVKDEKLPTVGVGGNLYYINPSKKLIPEKNSFLAPFVVGLNVSWNITEMFRNRNKLEEAQLQRTEINTSRDLLNDNIKMEVNQAYTRYTQSLQRIKVLQDAVVQSTENERIMESKFRNNLATTTDRIDAQTLLYESRLQLELAKADATAAYYSLLQSTGHLQP